MNNQMRRILSYTLLSICLVGVGTTLSGCYASRTTTDKEPSQKKIEKKWATGFLFGLATPGANVNATERCGNGVAVVETKLSFLNMVASNLTFGLYTPMSVTVTCAAGNTMSGVVEAPDINFTLEKGTSDEEARKTIYSAAQKSAETAEPVPVQIGK